MSEELLKRDIAIDSSLVHYDDGFLLGSLINIEDSQGTDECYLIYHMN